MYILLYGSSCYETKNSVLTKTEGKSSNTVILYFVRNYALFLKTCQAMIALIILTLYRTPEISNTTYLLIVSSFIFLCFKMKIDFKIIAISQHRYIEIKMIINHKLNNHNEVLTFLKTAKFNGIRRHNALQNKPHFHQNKSSQNFLLRSREKRIKNLYAFLFL